MTSSNSKYPDKCMDNMKKEALKAAKEIAVKFIETGRLSPASFADTFPGIYKVVLDSLQQEPGSGSAKPGAKKE